MTSIAGLSFTITPLAASPASAGADASVLFEALLAPAGEPERQEDAAPGKDLPETDPAQDMAWLGTPALPCYPLVTSFAAGDVASGRPVAVPASRSLMATNLPQPAPEAAAVPEVREVPPLLAPDTASHPTAALVAPPASSASIHLVGTTTLLRTTGAAASVTHAVSHVGRVSMAPVGTPSLRDQRTVTVPTDAPANVTPTPPFVLSEVEGRVPDATLPAAPDLPRAPATRIGADGAALSMDAFQDQVGSSQPLLASGALLARPSTSLRTNGEGEVLSLPPSPDAGARGVNVLWGDGQGPVGSSPDARARAVNGASTAVGAPAAKPVPAAPALPGTSPPATPPAIDLAARTFADARHRALADERSADPLLPTAASTPLAMPAPAPVAQQQALDLTQHRWPEAMIERIEVFRDMADANDLSIRLAPDALGTIDVSLKRDGDAVQVQLTAEHAHTRQLLAEAQPRLAELAAERGVKLQHAGTDAGGGEPRHAPPAPALPAAPPSARAEEAPDTDTRIA